MPPANVEPRNEAVRGFFRAFHGDTEVFAGVLHPEVEWFPIEENHTPYQGLEAAVRNRNQWLETWEEHRFDVEDVIEDGDSVVAQVHIVARGRTSGAEVDIRFYPQFTVRDGKVAYIYDHADRRAALAAAGLADVPEG